ncbi:MAG: glycosyltransferase family 2 protein [Proteobacteria bacterium]|nr:glycosyltransferase family 2 protein [Pseudomonadota bacterium]
MEETLEASLSSILDQLDDNYEVLVVDDGSSDSSVHVIRELQKKYRSLRLIELERDPARKLGLTRNISISNARGDYVLLHLDCDDVFGPHVKDFVEVFHRIEHCVRRDILLSGQHINMAKREFLLERGPYRNLYRGEDRDLWSRLATINAYIPFDHVDFITRLPKPKKMRIGKTIIDTFDHMRNDLKEGTYLIRYIQLEFQKLHLYSLKLKLFRMAMIFPAWICSVFDEPLPKVEKMGSFEEFASYREKTRGTYSSIMKRHGCEPDLSFLSYEAQKVFGEPLQDLDRT